MILRIQDRKIGPGQPPYIIAELSANHNGSLDRALQSDQLTKRFFVHGEEESMYELKSLLSDDLQKKVVIPSKGESFQL